MPPFSHRSALVCYICIGLVPQHKLLRPQEKASIGWRIEMTRTIAVLMLFSAVCCGQVPVRFTDITQSSGIRFVHHNGAFGAKYLPETVGPGCAYIDYDNDGYPDILLVNGQD